jgi:hypothetical protein
MGMEYIDLMYLGVFILCLTLSYCAHDYLGIRREGNEIKREEIIIGYNIDDSVPMLLDTIIKESFDEYMILNEKYRKEDAINAEREKEISSGIVDFLKDRMSDYVMDKLLMYYHEDAIWKVVAEKVYIVVMNYAIENNSIIEDK